MNVNPVTNVSPVTNPVTLNVPPVLLVNVAVPVVYVPPVTLISVGRFWYVVADITLDWIVPDEVRPVTELIVADNVLPLFCSMVKVLSLYVNPVTNVSKDEIPETLKVPPVLLVKIISPPLNVPPVTKTSIGKLRYVVAEIVGAVKSPVPSIDTLSNKPPKAPPPPCT